MKGYHWLCHITPMGVSPSEAASLARCAEVLLVEGFQDIAGIMQPIHGLNLMTGLMKTVKIRLRPDKVPVEKPFLRCACPVVARLTRAVLDPILLAAMANGYDPMEEE